MEAGNKKGIYISDILLVGIALMCVVIAIYSNIGKVNQLIATIFFLIGTGLFIFKGYELNKLRKKRDNLKVLSFFEYYEEELEMMMKFKVLNMTLFFPLIKKEKTEELNRLRNIINILTLAMYASLILTLIIYNIRI